MNDLLNKVIKICEPTFPTGNGPIKLKDEEGLKYNLWKSSQKGESVAYAFFKNLEGGGGGTIVEIGYVEEPKSFTNKENKLINFTERTIRTMKNTQSIISTPEKRTTGQNLPSGGSESLPPKFLQPENTYNQDKPKDEVQNHIRWCNAINNSSLIISTLAKTETYEKVTEKIELLANFIYKLEPNTIPTGNETFNQPLGNNGEEVVPDGQREDQAELRSEDIPF